MNSSKYDWSPGVGVGDIRFGEPISELLDSGVLHHVIGPFDSDGRGFFALGEEEDPAIYLDEKNLADDVVCSEVLIYQGRDLIGMKIDDIIVALGKEPDEYGEELELGEDNIQITAEFDSLGLQLWLRDGVAVSAVVSAVIEDDD